MSNFRKNQRLLDEMSDELAAVSTNDNSTRDRWIKFADKLVQMDGNNNDRPNITDDEIKKAKLTWPATAGARRALLFTCRWLANGGLQSRIGHNSEVGRLAANSLASVWKVQFPRCSSPLAFYTGFNKRAKAELRKSIVGAADLTERERIYTAFAEEYEGIFESETFERWRIDTEASLTPEYREVQLLRAAFNLAVDAGDAVEIARINDVLAPRKEEYTRARMTIAQRQSAENLERQRQRADDAQAKLDALKAETGEDVGAALADAAKRRQSNG